MMNLSKGLSYWLSGKRSARNIPALGAREIAVLKIMWREGELSAQQLLLQMQDSQITLSTMQSTLERLYRKKLVSRYKEGRSYQYKATTSQSVIISSLLKDIATQISDGDMEPMVSGFMTFMDQETENSLPPELIRLLKDTLVDDDE